MSETSNLYELIIIGAGPAEITPDDWVCPICGASKDQFEKEE